MDDEELLLPKEAARRLRINITTLRRWAASGLIPSVPMPSGHRRYRPSDIEAIRRANGEPRVLVWDYREPIDLDELAEAIEAVSRGTVHLIQVQTETDDFAIVIAARLVDADEADQMYAESAGL